ncbi:DUF4303 domain-containing protein [Altererythrobacter xixiisoli]|uniref:DUF4303 domain-containing protein n=1 Tax=Croceibacterium xixiisoli TaxID=1476466 RepID=A0A6I4TR54_9SPHN|nr:DUF4303 domain-containing protein [Croceibacterium xixiisoli]MXO97601.1 DUF4303 domain-containing protein [Croceibacterium xixiisoli]
MGFFEAVQTATIDAVRQAASEAYQKLGKEDLFGFGLCTHDDVDTVYHVYATRDWVREREVDDPEIGLISVEWTLASDDAPFLALSRMLQEWASSDETAPDADYLRDRRERFRALVEAMKICRDEGVFDAGTLLSVSSTDPDEAMVVLACDAARQLNTQENAVAYCEMMGC